MGPTDEHPHMYDTDMIITSYNKHLQSTTDDIRHWVLYVTRHVEIKDRNPILASAGLIEDLLHPLLSRILTSPQDPSTSCMPCIC
jgi:hypothetical protein